MIGTWLQRRQTPRAPRAIMTIGDYIVIVENATQYGATLDACTTSTALKVARYITTHTRHTAHTENALVHITRGATAR